MTEKITVELYRVGPLGDDMIEAWVGGKDGHGVVDVLPDREYPAAQCDDPEEIEKAVEADLAKDGWSPESGSEWRFVVGLAGDDEQYDWYGRRLVLERTFTRK